MEQIDSLKSVYPLEPVKLSVNKLFPIDIASPVPRQDLQDMKSYNLDRVINLFKHFQRSKLIVVTRMLLLQVHWTLNYYVETIYQKTCPYM